MKQVTFVYTTRSNTDGAEIPSYAYFQVTQGFIDRLKELHSLIVKYGLTEVRESSGPEYQNEDAFGLDCHEIVVTAQSTWFRCWLKHTDAEVETCSAPSVDDYQEKFDLAENNSTVFIGEESEGLDALEWYEEAIAEFDT